ncbi:MAG: chemotaxis protein CheY [Fibrobacteres bacterium]|nr:chemotaxis protein CheY [Fibrobacterota bacterium]
MKRKVIIIDDSKFLQNILQEFFQDRMGYEVVAVGTNGVDAVQLYRQHLPDLMTLDITMPVKDGVAALEELMPEFPEAKVLLVSAVSGDSILECLRLGARGYIEKPLRFEDEEFRKEFIDLVESMFLPVPKD